MIWALEGGDAVGFGIALLPFAFSIGASLGFHWEHSKGFGSDDAGCGAAGPIVTEQIDRT